MKRILMLTVAVLLYTSCSSIQKTNTTEKPVRIANDDLKYEIIIIDNGFETYLNSIAKPMDYHSESYLENKNKFYVNIWNTRAIDLTNYNGDIYVNVINYDFNTHYGLEVNYKLYNYFKFVEYKYGEKF